MTAWDWCQYHLKTASSILYLPRGLAGIADLPVPPPQYGVIIAKVVGRDLDTYETQGMLVRLHDMRTPRACLLIITDGEIPSMQGTFYDAGWATWDRFDGGYIFAPAATLGPWISIDTWRENLSDRAREIITRAEVAHANT